VDIAFSHWSASWPALTAYVLAGAVIWMGMLFPLVVGGVALLRQWFSNEESAELAADLDLLLAARPHGWPSRPVHR
jgi:hypothetical protein